jgi:DNA replication protein DnaC
MTPAQLERLGEQLQRLRLFKSKERLEALLQEAANQELPYADFLERVLSEEVASKTAKHISMRTSLARFPFVKSLDVFDFAYQPSLDKKQIQSLASCHFIEHGENIVVLGPPGVGKSHLAVGLGLKAIEHGYRVLVYHRRGHDHHPHQGARRRQARGQAQVLYRAEASDHR